MSGDEYLDKDKVIDDLLLLVAKKNKRIKVLEDEIDSPKPQENK